MFASFDVDSCQKRVGLSFQRLSRDSLGRNVTPKSPWVVPVIKPGHKKNHFPVVSRIHQMAQQLKYLEAEHQAALREKEQEDGKCATRKKFNTPMKELANRKKTIRKAALPPLKVCLISLCQMSMANVGRIAST